MGRKPHFWKHGKSKRPRKAIQQFLTLEGPEQYLTKKTVLQDQGSSQERGTTLLNTVSIPLENIPVGGCLKHFVYRWHKFTRDPQILDIVSGMLLDFTKFLKQEQLPHEIKMNESEFAAAVELGQALLSKGVIVV